MKRLFLDKYEKLMAKLDLLHDIREAEEQITKGKGVSHKAALKRALRRVKGVGTHGK